MLRTSYSDHFLSICVCVRVYIRLLIFSNDFSFEATEPILLKFYMEHPLVGNERLLKWSRSIDQDGRHAHIW